MKIGPGWVYAKFSFDRSTACLWAARSSPGFRLVLRRASEEIKIGLSKQLQISVNMGLAGQEPALVHMDRDQLDAATRHLVSRLWGPLESLARDTRTQLGGQSPENLQGWKPPQAASGASLPDKRLECPPLKRMGVPQGGASRSSLPLLGGLLASSWWVQVVASE